MIDSRDEIDRLFRDKLSHYVEEAPPHIWERIADKLEKKRHARMIRFYASLAASVAVLLSMAIGYYFGQYQVKQQVVGNISPDKHTTVTASHPDTTEPSELSASTTDSNISFRHPSMAQGITKTRLKQASSHLPTQAADSNRTTDMMLVQDSFPANIANRRGFCQSGVQNRMILAEKNVGIKEETAAKGGIFDRIYLSFTAAPLYSYRVVNGVQSMTLNNFEKPTVTFSAGMNGIFAGRRFQLSVGLYFTQMALRIDDVALRRNDRSAYESLTLYNSEQSAALLNSSGNIQPTTHEWVMTNTEPVMAYQYPDQTLGQNGVENTNKSFVTHDNMRYIPGELTSLTQKFHYIEIPLNFQYNIYQQRFIVGIQTGVNANLLVSNGIYTQINNQQTRVGETENIRTFNVAGTLGISVAVPFTQRLSFLVEPRFRYYLLSVNRDRTIDTHPYSYGIYTGIRVRY